MSKLAGIAVALVLGLSGPVAAQEFEPDVPGRMAACEAAGDYHCLFELVWYAAVVTPEFGQQCARTPNENCAIVWNGLQRYGFLAAEAEDDPLSGAVIAGRARDALAAFSPASEPRAIALYLTEVELGFEAELFATTMVHAQTLQALRADTSTAEYRVLAGLVGDPQARIDQAIAAINEVFQ